MTALLIATHYGPGHHGFWFPLVPLLFLALWIGAAVFIARRWGHPHRHSGEAVLAVRYARGEITETEYQERRAVLRGKA